MILKGCVFMPFEGAVKQAYSNLSPAQQLTACQFILFLGTQPSSPSEVLNVDVASNGKKILRKPGLYEGKIKMSSDFDAPLDDFKEYMNPNRDGSL